MIPSSLWEAKGTHIQINFRKRQSKAHQCFQPDNCAHLLENLLSSTWLPFPSSYSWPSAFSQYLELQRSLSLRTANSERGSVGILAREYELPQRPART